MSLSKRVRRSPRSASDDGSTYPSSRPFLHPLITDTNPPLPHPPSANLVTSAGGFLRTFVGLSLDGVAGSPIILTVVFTHIGNRPLFVRLIFGDRPLNTAVRQMADKRLNTWELECIAPPFNGFDYQVPLIVEALSNDNDVLDAITVGRFAYDPATVSPSASVPRPSPRHHYSAEHVGIPDEEYEVPIPLAKPSKTRPAIPRSSSSRSRSGAIGVRPSKKQALRRAKPFEFEDGLPDSQRVILEMTTPTDSVAENWSKEEIAVGRRLVLFKGRQDGQRLKVSCQVISQQEYKPDETVISCIYRKDTQTCFITSVDIIYLLEGLVGNIFEIEEKNRIRRNLEGFRPKTISKNRSTSEEFFQQIMEFPVPKPRNIEKDVKVFEWSILPRALEKILSKYSLCSSFPYTDRFHNRASLSPPDMIHSLPPQSPQSPRFLMHPSPSSSFLYNDSEPFSELNSARNLAHGSISPFTHSIPVMDVADHILSPFHTDSPSSTPSPRSPSSSASQGEPPSYFYHSNGYHDLIYTDASFTHPSSSSASFSDPDLFGLHDGISTPSDFQPMLRS